MSKNSLLNSGSRAAFLARRFGVITKSHNVLCHFWITFIKFSSDHALKYLESTSTYEIDNCESSKALIVFWENFPFGEITMFDVLVYNNTNMHNLGACNLWKTIWIFYYFYIFPFLSYFVNSIAIYVEIFTWYKI